MFDYNVIDHTDISGEAPETEPARQYYFMKKCKMWFQQETECLGRTMTVSMQTMGCPIV